MAVAVHAVTAILVYSDRARKAPSLLFGSCGRLVELGFVVMNKVVLHKLVKGDGHIAVYHTARVERS